MHVSVGFINQGRHGDGNFWHIHDQSIGGWRLQMCLSEERKNPPEEEEEEEDGGYCVWCEIGEIDGGFLNGTKLKCIHDRFLYFLSYLYIDPVRTFEQL